MKKPTLFKDKMTRDLLKTHLDLKTVVLLIFATCSILVAIMSYAKANELELAEMKHVKFAVTQNTNQLREIRDFIIRQQVVNETVVQILAKLEKRCE